MLYCWSKRAILWEYRRVSIEMLINTSISDNSRLFFPSWLKCWSTADQSPLRENASTRFSSSQRRTDGGVLLSNKTADPRRADWDLETGLDGLREERRLEGADPPVGWFAIYFPDGRPAERNISIAFSQLIIGSYWRQVPDQETD